MLTSLIGANTGINPNFMPNIDVSSGGFISDVTAGEQLADSIVTMLKNKHICGPFSIPPFFRYRINLMFPLKQSEKTRMIVNMSFPEGKSFNDNIPKLTHRKVTMTSAPFIGELIRRNHGHAIMSKYDHAYKTIPCKLSEIKFQGLRFLGKYFFECRQIFGATSSVTSYDDLHLLMVILASRSMHGYVNTIWLPRILDDLVGIFRSKALLLDFHNKYTLLANEIGIKLQPSIGSKAFVCEEQGVALGIHFSSKDMTWGLPTNKQTKYLAKIHEILDHTYVTLNQLQEVNGVINYIVSMSPILRFIRHHILHEEKRAQSAKDNKIMISFPARFQLITWANIIQELSDFPIPIRDTVPPIKIICLLSDAAGKPKILEHSNIEVAAAAVAYISPNTNLIATACQAFFPHDLVTHKTDDNGIRFGDKSTFLELSAILLGIIRNKNLIAKRQVLILSDSLPALWALQKGRSPTCLYSSTLCLAIATLLNSFESYFYTRHIPRKTNYAAIVADGLTRKDKTSDLFSKIFKDKLQTDWPTTLQTWLQNPSFDDTLGARILDEISREPFFAFIPNGGEGEGSSNNAFLPFTPLGNGKERA